MEAGQSPPLDPRTTMFALHCAAALWVLQVAGEASADLAASWPSPSAPGTTWPGAQP